MSIDTSASNKRRQPRCLIELTVSEMNCGVIGVRNDQRKLSTHMPAVISLRLSRVEVDSNLIGGIVSSRENEESPVVEMTCGAIYLASCVLHFGRTGK